MKPLRDYQQNAVDAVVAEAKRGSRAILIVAPTGAGKTRIGCEFIARTTRRGKSVLFVCHRSELIKQTAAALLELGIATDIIAPWAPQSGPSLFDSAKPLVQVASIQTLLARGLVPEVSLVILDEAHHYVSQTWGDIAKKLSQAWTLGLTATPQRGDGAPLGDLFTTLVPVAQPQQLIDEGFLVPIDVYGPDKQSKTIADPVNAFFSNPATHHDGKPRRTIVFCTNVVHARETAERFAARGVRSACIDEELDWKERENIVSRFAHGELDMLTNVYCLTEGLDVPAIEVVVLARGCGSQGAFIQMVGRAMRPSPGKERAVLIDCKGSVWQHGLPSLDRIYSLEGEAIAKKDKKEPTRTCSACGAIFITSGWICPRCGAELPRPKPPKEKVVQLGMIQDATISWDEKLAYFVWLKHQCMQQGYKMGWCSYRFKSRYGHFPPASMWRAA